MSNSTLSGNSAGYGAGGIFQISGALTLKSTLLANESSGGNCNLSGGTSDGYNLDDDGSCGLAATGDQTPAANPPAAAGLDPSGLQNNGGPTPTIALVTGSTAIDAIPVNECTDAFGSPVSTDQRGIARPQGAGCDIGAFELAQVPTANVCTAGSPTPCSVTITLDYYIPSSTSLDPTTPVTVVTQGTPGLDFTLYSRAAFTTCTSGLAGPAPCVVYVTFAPIAPGLRLGAVTLTDSLGNPFATTLIEGIGTGSALAFTPGIINTVAGNGTAGYSGDGGPATSAQIQYPYGVAVDSAGNLYIPDFSNSVIRKVSTSGTITTVAGNHALGGGYSGDNGPATSAELNRPAGVAVDGAGNLYIADLENNVIRKVNASGTITSVAGGGSGCLGQTDPYGDGCPATSAELYSPTGVAVDGAGNLYIADLGSQHIRKVNVTASALSFPTTNVGQISSPQSVVVSDVGNASLNFISFGISSNFQFLGPRGGDCLVGTALTAGADCNLLGAFFAPLIPGNPLTGTITVADDAFDSPQSVSLSGVAPVNTVNVTVGTSPSGLLVSVDGGASQAAPVQVTWNVGTPHTIAASSPQGSSGTRYTFTGWSDSGAQSHMVTASTSTTSYTTGFSTSYFLTAAASPTAGGSVGVNPTSPTNDGYYASGSQVTLTATIKTGYLFVNWTGTTTSSTNPLKVTMNSPVSEAANFTNMVPVTITTSPTGLLVSVDGGSNQAAPLNLSWQIGSKHTIATTSPQGTGTRYLFSKCSDNGAISHSVTIPSNAVTYTASFTPTYELTTIVSPSGAGTISPASGNYYSPGTVVNLGTSSYNGYVFQNWSGSVANASKASTTVTMSAPETVTAIYAELPTQLAGSINSKSGLNSARVWKFLIENTGLGAANAAQLSSLTLTQTLGPACTPQITTMLPLSIGNMAPESYVYASVTINFGSCSAVARFTVNGALTANQGRANETISETGQAP